MPYHLSPVATAYPLIPEYLRNNPAISIPTELPGETEFIMDLGDYEQVYHSIWAKFKLN